MHTTLLSAISNIPKFGSREFTPNKEFNTDGLISSSTELGVKLYSWGIIALTAVFVLGTLMMILSAIFKNGQWQKLGQNFMFWSFVSLLLLRGLPILILSIRNTNDIDSLFNEFIVSLSYTAVYLGVISLACGLMFKLGHKLIKHPEFYRRSKTLFMVSIIMVSLSILIPNVFPQV
ncbi:hypothetical protein MKZ20_21610 [Psychrobacillus sp. FSL K6-2684]|uniref:hypothetical protein n=1 Tax=unclassified Psychrobacillus TaxID=2636677 RepID=UPI0030FAA9B8